MAIERYIGNGWHFRWVFLVMNECSREDKYITPLENLCEETIFGAGGHKSHFQGALDDSQDLRGTRVKVKRVHSAGLEVDASERDAKRVEPWNL